MPIDKRFEQPAVATTTYTETITQPIGGGQKDPNWANYVDGTQSTVFNTDQGLGFTTGSGSGSGSDFNNQSGMGSTGYTSTNIGGSGLGKTDSTFGSSHIGGGSDVTAMNDQVRGPSYIGTATDFAPSNISSSNIGGGSSDYPGSTSMYQPSTAVPTTGLGLQSDSSCAVPSTNFGSNNDSNRAVGGTSNTCFTGGAPTTSNNFGPTGFNESSNLGFGSSTLGGGDATFDPSMPQGVDAAVDRRAQTFYTGVDCKSNILSDIKDGSLNKKLNHVDRDSSSNLNSDNNNNNNNNNNSNNNNNNSNNNNNNNNDSNSNTNRNRDNSDMSDMSNNTNSNTTRDRDAPAHQDNHREGAYMPETTRDGEQQKDGEKLHPEQEKKPFPERVADWLTNKIHPNKAGTDANAENDGRSDNLDQANRGNRSGIVEPVSPVDQNLSSTRPTSNDRTVNSAAAAGDVRSDRV